MKKLLGLVTLLIIYVTAQSQTTVANSLQVNTAKGTAPSQAIPVNGGIAYFDANGILKKTTALAGLGAKVTSVTATNDSTLSIVTDAGTTPVLVRGLFTPTRQKWFDSLKAGQIFDTIRVQQVGAGINPIYSNAAGTILLGKALRGSGTIEIQRATDSSLVFNSLYAFPQSVIATGTNGNNIGLVGDNASPPNGSVYSIQGGSKGWYLANTFAVATSTANGLLDFRLKNRIDSIVTFTNFTVGGTYDSIAVASPTLDSVILKGQKFRGAAGSSLSVTNQGNVFTNDYVFDIGIRVAQASATADGTSTVYNIAHGLTGVTTSSPAIVSPRNALANSQPYIVTVTSTNIVITYSSPPSAGSMLYSYIIRP